MPDSLTHSLRTPVTIVVGAGGSGAVVAARLAQSGRTVVVLEAGVGRSLGATPADQMLHDATTLIAAACPETSWNYPAALTPERPWTLVRGKGLGGSTAVNAGYFVQAAERDRLAWQSEIGWGLEAIGAAYRRAETDHDFGATALHGGTGPLPVRRPSPLTGLAARLAHAARGLGMAELEDASQLSSASGYAALPRNVEAGTRWDTGRSYLAAELGRENLTVVAGAQVTRLLFAPSEPGDNPRVTGVEANVDGDLTRFEADQVVLCAGAIGTAHLLLCSGIGPAEELAEWGIDLRADLPVGQHASDHPQVVVGWRPTTVVDTTESAVSSAPNDVAALVIRAGDVELLPLLRSTAALFGNPMAALDHPGDSGPELDLLVADQAPEARAVVRLQSADPAVPPTVIYNYASSERDRATLRSGVRLAVELVSELGTLVDLPTELLDPSNESALDEWIAAHLSTALHLAGTAPAGHSPSLTRVTDPAGQVVGVTGLRIADLSLLPAVPTRGPAATAVMLGELLALPAL